MGLFFDEFPEARDELLRSPTLLFALLSPPPFSSSDNSCISAAFD